MSHEPNVGLLCARTFLNPSEAGSLQLALQEHLNWKEIERYADEHRVMPIVAYVLAKQVGKSIPQDDLKRLQDRSLRTVRNNLLWTQEWLRILKSITEAGIRVIPFKGPALGLMTYRNLALREFDDLDLLVQPRDVSRARDVLIGAGYMLSSVVLDDTNITHTHSSSREICFTQIERGFAIDLHWGLLNTVYPFQLDVGQLFEAAVVQCHEKISFLSLSPEHLLLYLCAHGTKHHWSSLRWLCDVASHVQSNPNMNWDRCIYLAKPAGCELVLKHSLILAGQVLGLELPEPLSQYANQDAKARMLAKTAQQFLFRENDITPRYSEVLRYYLAFAKSWRNHASLILMPVFVPLEPDWRFVRLPRPLYFLYYLVRPIRLVIKHLWGRQHAQL
jgi:Uncharacterised nucleotidyltransferase